MFCDLTCELHYILVLLIKHLNHRIYTLYLSVLNVGYSSHKQRTHKTHTSGFKTTSTLLLKLWIKIIAHLQRAPFHVSHAASVTVKYVHQSCSIKWPQWGVKCEFRWKTSLFSQTWHTFCVMYRGCLFKMTLKCRMQVYVSMLVWVGCHKWVRDSMRFLSQSGWTVVHI